MKLEDVRWTWRLCISASIIYYKYPSE